MKKIKVYCGVTVENKCDIQRHPLNEVKRANDIILNIKDNTEYVFYSNSSDFVSTIKYLSDKYEIETEFFLNDISTGNDIEEIFDDFNKSIDLLDELIGDFDFRF